MEYITNSMMDFSYPFLNDSSLFYEAWRHAMRLWGFFFLKRKLMAQRRNSFEPAEWIIPFRSVLPAFDKCHPFVHVDKFDIFVAYSTAEDIR